MDNMNKKNAVWLVDLENTGGRWAGAAHLFRPGDTVAIFWSDKSCDVNMKSLPSVPGLKYMFVPCSNGTPNALDFQLSAWLGRMSVLEPDAAFVILSKDKGYAPLAQFLEQESGIKVTLVDPAPEARPGAALADSRREQIIPEDPGPGPEPAAEQPMNRVRAIYTDMLRSAGVSGAEDLRVLSAILMQSMQLPQNMRKLDARNRLAKKYGAQEGNLRYNSVKDVIKKIAENGPYPGTSGIEIHADDVNQALSKAGVTLKAGQVAKAVNALKIAVANDDISGARKSLGSSVARIFHPHFNKKAFAALAPFLEDGFRAAT